ncbi:MAG: peptidyl-prolyl cis-trans isomerase [Myxococcales bacterium]
MARPVRPVSRLFAALLLASAAVACTDRDKGPQKVEAVAVVNGVPLTVEAFERELAFARRTSAGMQPQTDEDLAAFRRSALEDYIDRAVALAAAKAAGVTVAPERVEREMLRLKAEYHGGSFDEALAEGQLSQQELQERTRERLTIEKYFVEHVFSRVAVTDAEVEAWYNEHPDEFTEPEQVRAAQIVVKTPEEAKRVLAELRKGVRFDEAARLYSLSPDARVGGDLGWFARGTMPPTFDQTCFSLQVGKISDVVASEYGFHVFKVLDKRAAGKRPLESSRAEVEKRLVRQKREEAQRKVMKELRDAASVTVDEAILGRVK